MKVRRRMVHKLITIQPEKTVIDALNLMKKHSIRHLPVIDGHKFVGFVSEFDLREVRLLPMSEESGWNIDPTGKDRVQTCRTC